MKPNDSKNRPLRVLILEDSPADAELVQRELRRAGIDFTARLAEDRKGFESDLQEFRPQVILSDFSLPQFDGMSALKLAREHAPGVPFLFVSGSIGEATAIEALNHGASDYIFKDNLRRLAPAVTRVMADVETRRQKREAEERLRESEEYYRTLVETSPDAIIIANAGGRITFASSRTRELVGLPDGAALEGLAISEFVEAEEWKRVQERLAELLSGRSRPEVREYRLRTRDGRPFWGEIYSSPLRDAQGRITDLLLICRDVSARKRSEEVLRQSEERFRRFFEEHAAAKLILDAEDGAIIDANRAACEYYGWTRDELRAMNIRQINVLPAEEVGAAIRTPQTEKRVHFEFRHRRADNSIRDVEVFTSHIHMEGMNVLYSIIHDISERKLSEAKVAEQLEELRRWQEATLGREERVIELKREVNELLARLGEPLRYPGAASGASEEAK